MKQELTKKKYAEVAAPEMAKVFGMKNPMALPRVLKVIVNVGTGKSLKDTKKVEEILETLTAITGQRPVQTKAKKAIAGFKTREGLEIGAKVTLRGRRMWQFLDRLLNAALPRTRDFQGYPESIVDTSGNCNIGIREQLIFPEVIPERVQSIFGLQVTIVSTAQNKQEGETLFRLLGVPIKNDA